MSLKVRKLKALKSAQLSETGFLSLTIKHQDTSPRIHPSRNKKPVSDKGAPEFISRKSMLQSQISNLKSRNRLTPNAVGSPSRS